MKRIFYSVILVFSILCGSSFVYAGEVVLMFPKFETKQKAMLYRYKASPYKLYHHLLEQGENAYIRTKLEAFVRRFEKKDYRVDQIELWIDAKAKSGDVTKLFISLEGSGGCKVILKPKHQQ